MFTVLSARLATPHIFSHDDDSAKYILVCTYYYGTTYVHSGSDGQEKKIWPGRISERFRSGGSGGSVPTFWVGNKL